MLHSLSARAKLVILVGALVLAPALGALEPRELLEPQDAFRLSAVALDAKSTQIDFRIAKGYYLYRERFRLETADGKVIAGAELPKGTMKRDPFFGLTEIYREWVSIRVPLGGADLTRGRIRLKVVSQGCSDSGVCYIPQEQWVDVGPGNGPGRFPR
jgi:thiol:disulfide interchange protein DsbD